MPPKKDSKRKASAITNIYQSVSDSSLLYVPEDAVEGFQERIETGIEWTLLEEAAHHHKKLSQKEDIPKLSFSNALHNKIRKSYMKGFYFDDSGLSIEKYWELLLPITLWENEKFANEEGKICFRSENAITDDMLKLIKRAVRLKDKEVLRREFMLVPILRVNDSKIAKLDEELLKFTKLAGLVLCGNVITEVDASCLPQCLRSLELHANWISSVSFVEYLPPNLLYLGLARNLLTTDGIDNNLSKLPHSLSVLDLSDNDIYHLQPVLKELEKFPHLESLSLAGNPCSLCIAYSKLTLSKLPRLRWLDSREVLPEDRVESMEPHANELRSNYFFFSVFRLMTAFQPPKPEKGVTMTFHVEVELPLLDSTRRRFLMFQENESLVEMKPPPEDESWFEISSVCPTIVVSEASTIASRRFKPEQRNPREIIHFTRFETTRVQWSKLMTFHVPAVRIFCPDLTALRDTFRSVITVRIIYTVTAADVKPAKADKKNKKNMPDIKTKEIDNLNRSQTLILATIKCPLKKSDWSQPFQHFHWDDTLGTPEAIHWGDGDLAAVQYTQASTKESSKSKGKAESNNRIQSIPEDTTIVHIGFGIETLKGI